MSKSLNGNQKKTEYALYHMSIDVTYIFVIIFTYLSVEDSIFCVFFIPFKAFETIYDNKKIIMIIC